MLRFQSHEGNGGRLAGVVNLIDIDDEARSHLHPWLAALIVVPEYRGRGFGGALVQGYLAEAQRLGFTRVYLGTDAPDFYRRLGAQPLEWARPDLLIMWIETAGA